MTTTPATLPTRNLIDGRWRDAADGGTITVLDPATGAELGRVPSVTAVDVQAAVDAAAAAFPAWRDETADNRSRILRRLADLVLDNREELAALIAREGGKPVGEARGEVQYGHSFLEWSAEEAKRIYGELVPTWNPDKRIMVLRSPVGVTAAITPWNFPLAMITRKAGPALATGCTQVVKPASQTPLTALALGALALEAGVPPGVLNVITGRGALVADVLFADPRVRKVSFTGSTEVGQDLIRRSAQNVTRLSLELGGHAPVIVLDDCDLDVAVAGVLRAKFRNNGQSCIAANRIYVADAVHDEFCARFTAAVRALTVGATTGPADVGPLIDENAVATVQRHLDDAVRRGAVLATGGHRAAVAPGLSRLFWAPTVLTGVTDDMTIFREETFGPVAAVSRFRTDAEAVRRANDSPYGLAAYVFGRDLGRVLRVVERLEYGVVGVNDGAPSTGQAPFGGRKLSGYGTEGGKYAFADYLDTKYVSLGL